ncbi:MAG: nucleotidyltransferase family protein [Thermoanaerobaculia bacterium]
MTKEEIIEFLKEKREYLYKEFGVVKIGIFGSYSRNEQNQVSDLDIVVDFEDGKKNIHNFLNLKRFLEKQLSIKVDLATESSIKSSIKKYVLQDLIYV